MGSEILLAAMVMGDAPVARVGSNEWNESNKFVNPRQAPPPQLSRLIRLGADSGEHALVTFQFAI